MITAKLLAERPEKYDGLWLSVSKIKTFKQCAAKYWFSYVKRIPSKSWDHLLFGNFLHKVLEDFYDALIHGSKLPLHELLTNVFKRTLNSKDFKGKLTKELKTEAWQISNRFLEKVSKEKNQPDVLDVETKFFIDINNGEVLLNGLIDRIQMDQDGMLHVADYKTTKNKKYLIGDYFQLLTYAYVMCLSDESLEELKTSYILLRHDFESITKKYKKPRIMQMGDELLKCADEINSEKLWRPTVTGLCNWCDYKPLCSAHKKSNSSKKFGKISW